MFRPCIDLHDGKVKQIVGSSLGSRSGGVETNFATDRPADWYAALYRKSQLRGGHVIMLGPGNDGAARPALGAWPGGLQLGGQDVFVSAAGGVQVAEPAADLAIALAIASSFTDKPLAPRSVFMGEVGLGGKIRSVTQIDARIAEAARLGFKRAFVPKESAKPLAGRKTLDIVPVSNIIEALDGCTGAQ